jgi:beta-lactamase class D
MQTSREVDGFWRDGSLQISAVEQAEFLSRLAKGTLPVEKKALDQTRELTLKEQTTGYKLHSKSGLLTTGSNSRLGWWVGWVERENEMFSFALNVDMTSGTNPQALAAIGRECLRALGKL